jgi:type II secretory pathway pseudopilin PulG
MNKRGFSLITLLLSVLVLGFLYYFATQIYFKSSPSGRKIKKELAGEGIKTDNYADMLESTQKKAEEVSRNLKKRQDELNKVAGE